MLDVIELVCGVIKHSRNPNVMVSRNGRELLECPMCLVPMYPPIHQVCLLAELITFIRCLVPFELHGVTRFLAFYVYADI